MFTRQTQERARKLRADLAVEEQREEEISRILKEIIHAPRKSDPWKSRLKRRVRFVMNCHREPYALDLSVELLFCSVSHLIFARLGEHRAS